MTENYYTERHNAEHNTFGGYVYNYDYNGYNSITEIAQRILSDFKFDKKCENNILQKKGGTNEVIL